MLARREAIESAGYLDERYFMYSDETDLCRRIKTAGWEMRHLPSMTILHHDGKAGVKPSIESLGAWTRVAYARKHFSPVHRAAYCGGGRARPFAALGLRRPGEQGRLRRQANRQAVATLLGRAPVPYGPPSRVSLRTGAAELRDARTLTRSERVVAVTDGSPLDGRNVLITGGGGQLASDLEELLAGRCQRSGFARSELDITEDGAVDAEFERARPAVVFNCAAFHNVEVCEREEDRSFEVNARAVKRLAERCAGVGATLVHVSTNYVFAGDRDEPYSESDAPSPRSIYALSKLAGEYAALAYCADCPRRAQLVVSTASHGSASKGGNFVQRMLVRAREQGALKMVADQRLSPTYTADLAGSLVEAVEGDVRGLLHVTNAGSCSWHEFTLAIMDDRRTRGDGRAGGDGTPAGRGRPAAERGALVRARPRGGPRRACVPGGTRSRTTWSAPGWPPSPLRR